MLIERSVIGAAGCSESGGAAVVMVIVRGPSWRNIIVTSLPPSLI